MTNYKKLTMSEAKAIVEKYDNMDDSSFSDLIHHWEQYDIDESAIDDKYIKFRCKMIDAFKNALDKNSGKMNYQLDLEVGLQIYQLLPPGQFFTAVQYNDDDIWRYISVCVMPDVTYLRYPTPEKGALRINRKRFYSHTRRIWLKSLWWYIFLSWQGNYKDTYNALKDNATDNINKLIETPGRGGYRVSLLRNIVKEYAATNPHKAKDFAAATKLNNAKCVSVEPALAYGGEIGYVDNLFSEIKTEGADDSLVE